MLISKDASLSLEETVRIVYHHREWGGLFTSDYFEDHPFDAAIFVFAPLYYSGTADKDVEDFIAKYRFSFEHPEEYGMTNEAVLKYCNELHALAKKCYNL